MNPNSSIESTTARNLSPDVLDTWSSTNKPFKWKTYYSIKSPKS